uniref:Uncharacterized protein n=1 Tax=Pyxicephalus adspersus TaxID=30357 RepID=A0AAV2ZT12_PYXAD|nr:TPA: hypothetical protein GDO54_016890 [Pyxicephalus adspersus]
MHKLHSFSLSQSTPNLLCAKLIWRRCWKDGSPSILHQSWILVWKYQLLGKSFCTQCITPNSYSNLYTVFLNYLTNKS